MASTNKTFRTLTILKMFLKGLKLTKREILLQLDSSGDDVTQRSVERDLQVLQELQLINSFESYGRKKVWEAWGYAKKN